MHYKLFGSEVLDVILALGYSECQKGGVGEAPA